MADQQFCLRWNNHQSTLISVFDTLLENGTLVDCTLAAEGQYLKAHKVVLCACSPYLETLLSQHYEKHPIVILKDVKFSELKSMMDYMYRGEVNISQDQLGTFLKAAESLQIKGLSDNGADGDARDVGSTPKAPPPRKATQPAPSSRPEPVRPDSPLTDGSMSPSSRKRRRVRRSSQDDDSHLESNSCDLPNQAQSTPVPNIPVATSSITTTPIVKPAIVKPEQTDVNRIDSNSLPPESLKKEIEPISEPLLEPKTEYLEDMNNEDSVEDLTLDDDDDMEGMDISNMSNMSNMSRPGPSHGNDISNQSFAPWQLGANQSGTDEVFMAAQEAVNQHRDSQDIADVPTSKQSDIIHNWHSKKNKEDFFEKEILMLSNELTEIVGTTESLANMCEKGKNTQEVVEFESSNIPQIIADVEDVINSTFIEDHIRSELEFQDLEEPIVVSLDGYNSQPDTKPEIDPLSELVAVKSESLGLENEKSLKNNTTFIDNDNKVMSFFVKRESGICPKCNLSCDPEGHVCLFKCDLCPYTAKYSRVLGQHKRRDHKILGSSKKVVGKNRQTVVKQNVGKHFQCNLCSYTARFSQIIGQHKRRVHNIVGIRSLQLNKKHAIVRNEQLSEKEEEQPLTENKQVSCRKDKRTQRHTVSREKEYKCNSCPYVTISSDAFRVHKRRKHSIQQNIKTIADITTLSVCNGKEKKPKKVTINRGKNGFKKRLYNIPRHKQFSIKSSNFISSSTKPTTSSDDLSDQQNITQVADYETYPNTEDISCDSKYYTATVFESQDIKHDEFSIIDTVNLKTIPESCSPSLVNFNPEPLIVNSQTLDEDSWIDIEENLNNIGTDICSKCNLSYDSNDHVCIYKCYLCSFTSRYSKVIIRHKLKVHKTQSVTGKFFKCDLCPFSAKYIQSIGKHKTKVHNVIGQASETFLKNKQCIIGNEVVKRFKCDLCPYKAKYIQNIGVHMKRVHETEGRTSEGCVREASVTETEVSDREHDAEVVNQEIQKDSEKDTLINIVENSVTPFSQGEKNTCPKCKMSCDSNNHVCSFKCNLCSYTSKYRKVILKHKNRVHNCSLRLDIVENTVTTFSQREKNTCPKCKMSSDSNNHICSFKCNLCTYTSKYRKLILKHKNQVHNCSVKPKNQPALGRYFKCDICSFTDKYIQNIGKHKIKVHKIIGQASEEYLRTKQCIIENQVGKLFKCNLCPYTAKYIQTIGVHKKRVHETIGRTSEEFLKEASAIETEVSREKFDTEIVNQEIQIILQDIELPPISDGATTSNENQRTQNRSNMKIKDVSEEIVDNFPKPSSEDESKHVSDTEKTISNFSLGGDINVKIQSQEKLSIKKRNKKKSNVGRKQNSDDAELYKCNNCPYETKNIGALHKHRWSKHKDSRKIKHIKGQSEKKQVMKRKLNERRKEVRKVKIGGQVRLICNCGKMYKNKFSLESHLRYHCNQEPRQCCYLCDYKTHRRSEVYRHQRTVHKLDIPYTKNRLKS